MTYDLDLVDQLRALLSSESGVSEKRMFGGLAFLLDGRMVAAVSGQGGLMVRIDPADQERLIADPRAEPMVMRGRSMTGWLLVAVDGSAVAAELRPWVDHGLAFLRSLPPR